MRSTEDIVLIILTYTGVSEEELKSGKGSRFILARQLVSYFLRDRLTTKEIGLLTNRDRTSVVYCIKRVKDLLISRDKKMISIIYHVTILIEGRK